MKDNGLKLTSKYDNATKDLFYDPRKSGSMRARENVKKAIVYIILGFICILWILPFVYLIIQSLSPRYESTVLVHPLEQWTINNYRALFDPSFQMKINGKMVYVMDQYPFLKWWVNTFLVALSISIFSTILTLMSSYAFSRLKFGSRKLYMKLILIIGMFPGVLGMIINYFLLKILHLNAGPLGLCGLVLISISGSVMGYYIAKGFFDTIPRSLDEAAMIDGANKHTIFWKVIMPLSKPIIVYTILLSFTGPWGDYIFASIVTSGQTEYMTVAVGLQQLLSKGADLATIFPVFCAAGVIVSLPIMILFFVLQRYYVEGVTGGAVKG